MTPLVGILVGSKSDLPILEKCTARLEELGVARVSYGPMSQNVALTALAKLVESVHAGGGVPDDMRRLN